MHDCVWLCDCVTFTLFYRVHRSLQCAHTMCINQLWYTSGLCFSLIKNRECTCDNPAHVCGCKRVPTRIVWLKRGDRETWSSFFRERAISYLKLWQWLIFLRDSTFSWTYIVLGRTSHTHRWNGMSRCTRVLSTWGSPNFSYALLCYSGAEYDMGRSLSGPIKVILSKEVLEILAEIFLENSLD